MLFLAGIIDECGALSVTAGSPGDKYTQNIHQIYQKKTNMSLLGIWMLNMWCMMDNKNMPVL